MAVVWAVPHFYAYFYGHDVVVYTDHSAVPAVLETSSINRKHAHWWSKLFGGDLKNIKIMYYQRKNNPHAGALFHSSVPLSATTSPNKKFMTAAQVHVGAVAV